MSSVEQRSTKGISLKFPPMTSVSRNTRMENTMSQMHANVPVPNLQYFQLPKFAVLSSNPAPLQQQRPF